MLRVLGHRVLIKVEEQSEKFKGTSFYIPTDDKDKHQQAKTEGTVIDVGKTAYKELGDGTPWVKVGDKVVFRKFDGIDTREPDGLFKLLNDEDILAIREE